MPRAHLRYVSLSISIPELGAKTLYANLGRAAGQTDPDVVYALIWNPQDGRRAVASGEASPAPSTLSQT